MEAALRKAEKNGREVVYPSRWDRLPAEIQHRINADVRRHRMSFVFDEIVCPDGDAVTLRMVCQQSVLGFWIDEDYNVNDLGILNELRVGVLEGLDDRSRQTWPSWIISDDWGIRIELYRCVYCGVLKRELRFEATSIHTYGSKFRASLCRPCHRLFHPKQKETPEEARSRGHRYNQMDPYGQIIDDPHGQISLAEDGGTEVPFGEIAGLHLNFTRSGPPEESKTFLYRAPYQRTTEERRRALAIEDARDIVIDVDPHVWGHAGPESLDADSIDARFRRFSDFYRRALDLGLFGSGIFGRTLLDPNPEETPIARRMGKTTAVSLFSAALTDWELNNPCPEACVGMNTFVREHDGRPMSLGMPGPIASAINISRGVFCLWCLGTLPCACERPRRVRLPGFQEEEPQQDDIGEIYRDTDSRWSVQTRFGMAFHGEPPDPFGRVDVRDRSMDRVIKKMSRDGQWKSRKSKRRARRRSNRSRRAIPRKGRPHGGAKHPHR